MAELINPLDEKTKTPILNYARIKENLSIPIPKNLISQKEKSKTVINFVNVTDLKDLLDKRAGIWTSEIRQSMIVGDYLMMVVRISIHSQEGIFSQDGNGHCILNYEKYGDTTSVAYAQAFRRACEGHGLGRELWRGEDDGGEDVEETSEFNQGEKKAMSVSTLVTGSQMRYIRNLGQRKGVDVDQRCREKANCRIEELSKRNANNFIQSLEALPDKA